MGTLFIILALIFVNIMLSLIIAYVGEKKGVEFKDVLILSLIFGPFIGTFYVIANVLEKKEEEKCKCRK